MEHTTFGRILYLLCSDWKLDVCTCSWLQGLDGASGRTRFERSSRSIRARSRALRSISPKVSLECSSSEEDEVSLALTESRAEFLEVSLLLVDPSEWRLTAYGASFPDASTIVLEARSIL